MSSLHVHYEYENGSANTIRPTSVTYPDGRVLTYNYGTAGGMNDRLSRVESLGFDGTGNLVQPAYLGLGTQVRTTMSEPQVRWDLATGSSPNPYAGLDRFGRVIDNRWTNYNTSATLDQIKYTYDRASNRVSRENVVAKAQTTPKYFDELYGYDGSNRLSLLERGQLAGYPPSSITNKQFAQDWGLDPTGNWKVFKEDANGDGSWDLNQTRTSNTVNEITAINETAGPSWVTPGYDSAGNMTTIPRPAEPTGDFTGVYDAWNRLVELRGLDDTVVGRYEYDGLTRRVVKQTFPGWEELDAADWDAMTLEDWNGLQLTQAHRRDYYYNSSWQILEERVENGTVFDRQYVWGLQYIDELVFRDRQLTSSVERNYVLQDANWNVTALTDDNGTVVERYSYSAYGVPTCLNPDFTPAANQEAYDWDLLYAGYKWDSESALYQVRFRYLQPALGGWVGRDPLGYEGRDLNLLRYARNESVMYVDPRGLQARATAVAGAIGGARGPDKGRYSFNYGIDYAYTKTGDWWSGLAKIYFYPESTTCICSKIGLYQIVKTDYLYTEIATGTLIKEPGTWEYDRNREKSPAAVIDYIGKNSYAKLTDQPGKEDSTIKDFSKFFWQKPQYRWYRLEQSFETGAICLDPISVEYGHVYGTVKWMHSIKHNFRFASFDALDPTGTGNEYTKTSSGFSSAGMTPKSFDIQVLDGNYLQGITPLLQSTLPRGMPMSKEFNQLIGGKLSITLTDDL